MPNCFYCDNEAHNKTRVYESDLGSIEIDICDECLSALEAGLLNEPEPYEEGI
jgi:formate dehydrogenase maturation protein FdhE